MTTCGYMIYAYDNGLIDYGTVALCNSLLIKKNCKVNDVALATDQITLDKMTQKHGIDLVARAFDHVIVGDSSSHSTGDKRYFDTRYTDGSARYINGDRYTAYDLSPFDETLLIDADYLVLDDTFDTVWGVKEDLLCNRQLKDLDHRRDVLDTGSRIDDMGIPLYWATVIYFKKSEVAKTLFDFMGFIKDNYEFYGSLYNCAAGSCFRNDYAISIALHTLYGFVENDGVNPLPVEHILISSEYDVIHDFIDGRALITSEPEQGRFNLHLVESNVHVMNKQNVTRNSEKMIRYAIS